MSNHDLKKASLTIIGKAGKYDYDRIKRSIANEMFKKFPKNPLAAFIWILRHERIPTEIEFELILRKLA